VTLSPRTVVNAAGAHAHDVLTLLASDYPRHVTELPVRPRKRCIFFFRCPAAATLPSSPPATPLCKAPLTVDGSGVYFRPEGRGTTDTFLAGVSPDATDDCDALDDTAAFGVTDADYEKLFESCIWPALYERVEAFGEIKVHSSWAGLYEYNTIDQNALIGSHPELPNLILANGFSGHGLQQSPACGRAVAELIEHGRFLTLDLSLFGPERVTEARAGRETGIV